MIFVNLDNNVRFFYLSKQYANVNENFKNISKKRKYILHKKHNFLGFFLLANYSFLVLGFVLSDKI